MAALAITAQAQPVKIIHQYELPPLSYLDRGYTQEQVDHAAANGLAFTERPGIASGLQRLAGNHFLSVSDRGPNFTVPAGRVFPLPRLAEVTQLYQSMSLFRQGKKDAARQKLLPAEGMMKPLPASDQHPFKNGGSHDDHILWLAYKEARTMLATDRR